MKSSYNGTSMIRCHFLFLKVVDELQFSKVTYQDLIYGKIAEVR